eukprot:363771-Chlamydomonas_euryale.AAC.4
MESLCSGFEEMQTQNARLLTKLAERDEAHSQLLAERVKVWGCGGVGGAAKDCVSVLWGVDCVLWGGGKGGLAEERWKRPPSTPTPLHPNTHTSYSNCVNPLESCPGPWTLPPPRHPQTCTPPRLLGASCSCCRFSLSCRKRSGRGRLSSRARVASTPTPLRRPRRSKKTLPGWRRSWHRWVGADWQDLLARMLLLHRCTPLCRSPVCPSRTVAANEDTWLAAPPSAPLPPSQPTPLPHTRGPPARSPNPSSPHPQAKEQARLATGRADAALAEVKRSDAAAVVAAAQLESLQKSLAESRTQEQDAQEKLVKEKSKKRRIEDESKVRGQGEARQGGEQEAPHRRREQGAWAR